LKFSPLVSNAFSFDLTKLPLNKFLLLVFKRVLILILKRVYQFEITSQIRYQFENPSFKPIERLKIFEIGGGAVLLLWAHALSPFGINRQKRNH
jgi:hypothetical protein